MKKNKNTTLSFILMFIVFTSIFTYVVIYPRKDKFFSKQDSKNQDTWQDYTSYLNQELHLSENVFENLPLSKKLQLHLSFLRKIQKCLHYNYEPEVEKQLQYNLADGGSREAILRGALSLESLDKLLEDNKGYLLNKKTTAYVQAVNKEYLIRDDFELPADLNVLELKLGMMDEVLNIADKILSQHKVAFFLWSGHLLQFSSNKNDAYFFGKVMDNSKLLTKIPNIPIDHLKAEAALSVCLKIEELSQ